MGCEFVIRSSRALLDIQELIGLNTAAAKFPWDVTAPTCVPLGAADTAAIVMDGNTYVLTDTAGGAVNDIIQLTGVTSAVAMSATDAAATIFIG